MTCTLAELARRFGGTLHGAGETVIGGAMPLGVATTGDITLVDATDKARKALASTRAAAAVVPNELVGSDAIPNGLPIIAAHDIHAIFTSMVQFFRPVRQRPRVGISPQAHVSPTAHIGDDVDIHAGATIEADVTIGRGSVIYPGVYIGAGCQIGEQVTLFPNVVLYENTRVGQRSTIHANAVLGAYGFGYKQVDGQHVLTQQLGYVDIGCDVEIGAGTTIDRGTYGPTVVGDGTKIDDQVMVGHNCRLGRHNLICSQVGFAGSTTTGDYVVMGGQVGLRDHIHIGDRAMVGAKSGVMLDVEAGTRVSGIPAHPLAQWKLQQVCLPKLPELRHEVRDLVRLVAELQARLLTLESADRPADGRQAA